MPRLVTAVVMLALLAGAPAGAMTPLCPGCCQQSAARADEATVPDCCRIAPRDEQIPAQTETRRLLPYDAFATVAPAMAIVHIVEARRRPPSPRPAVFRLVSLRI